MWQSLYGFLIAFCLTNQCALKIVDNDMGIVGFHACHTIDGVSWQVIVKPFHICSKYFFKMIKFFRERNVIWILPSLIVASISLFAG